MSEPDIYQSMTNGNTYQPFFDINMHYRPHKQMRIRGERKRDITMLLAARFNFVSAITLTWLFQIKRYKTLEMLNRLVKQGLLQKAPTIRAVDGVIYTLTYTGSRYASELMRQELYFRSSGNPLGNVNQNAIVHDTILAYVLLSGIHNRNTNGNATPLWGSFVTEREFRLLYPSTSVKAVDAIVHTSSGGVAAIEIENATKRKSMYQSSVLRFRDALVGDEPLYDKVFIIACSGKVFNDCKRFFSELLEELPNRYDKKTRQPLLPDDQAELLKNKIVIRSKFIDGINELHYS